MKRIAVILLLFCPNILFGQTDSARIIADYVVHFQDCEEDSQLQSDICRLKIGHKSVHYFSNYYNYRHTLKMGRKLNNDGMDYKASLNDMPSKNNHCGYWIYKDMAAKKLVFEIRFNVAYKEDIPTFNWNIEPGDSVICGYPCHKATTTFRGRTWNVWYTLDIPDSEGPWKLCGLPGLILSAHDTNGQFFFDCFSIKDGKGYDISYDLKRLKLVNPRKVQDLYVLERSDEDDYYLKMAGWVMGERYDENGHPEKYQPKTRCLLDYIEK